MSLLPETAIQAITAPDIDCLIVGLSGGLDSTALLHSLAKLVDRPRLKAIHINHGLQAEAGAWQAHCEVICAALGVSLMCQQVEVAANGSRETNARGGALSSFLPSALGHVIGYCSRIISKIKLKRASFRRCVGMAQWAYSVCPKQDPLAWGSFIDRCWTCRGLSLEAYAQTHGLKYVSDPSNADQTHDRNFIRHGITPLLNERFQGWSARLARQISFDETARALLAVLGREDLLKLQTPGGYSVAGFAAT